MKLSHTVLIIAISLLPSPCFAKSSGHLFEFHPSGTPDSFEIQEELDSTTLNQSYKAKKKRGLQSDIPNGYFNLLQSYSSMSGINYHDLVRDLDDLRNTTGLTYIEIMMYIEAYPSQYKEKSMSPKWEFIKRDKPLIPGKRAGDMYYTKHGVKGFLGEIYFGHTGIYHSTDWVIESGDCSGNLDTDATYRVSINSECWHENQTRAYVAGRPGDGASGIINGVAIKRAEEWWNLKSPYNWKFWDNKHDRGSGLQRKFNCSQLVWSAYLPYVDLDNNPNKWDVTPKGVTPLEIINHPNVRWY